MIYLDHAATHPLLPEVREAMAPWLEVPANASSVHRYGQAAAAALERARDEVAALLGRPAAGIVFTSGATEANHQGIRGWVAAGAGRIGASGIEHPSVGGAIAASGAVLQPLSVGADGVIALPGDDAEIGLLCMMAANHETGVIQPIGRGADWCRGRGSRLHVDAVQALASEAIDLAGADSVAVSGHKLGGPVGIGALSLCSGEAFPALLSGGAQERGRRGGTVPVAAAVGFGAACALVRQHREARRGRWAALSDRIRGALAALGARQPGAEADRLVTHTCAVFDGVAGESVVQILDLAGFAVSSGAACASGSLEPSPVLTAMGDPSPDGGVRISLGVGTTAAEVEVFLAAVSRGISALTEF